jgi:hypothetical protein
MCTCVCSCIAFICTQSIQVRMCICTHLLAFSFQHSDLKVVLSYLSLAQIMLLAVHHDASNDAPIVRQLVLSSSCLCDLCSGTVCDSMLMLDIPHTCIFGHNRHLPRAVSCDSSSEHVLSRITADTRILKQTSCIDSCIKLTDEPHTLQHADPATRVSIDDLVHHGAMLFQRPRCAACDAQFHVFE